MSHFEGHFEGAKTFLTLEMAHKVIVPQKKIMSRSFFNSGTLIVITRIRKKMLCEATFLFKAVEMRCQSLFSFCFEKSIVWKVLFTFERISYILFKNPRVNGQSLSEESHVWNSKATICLTIPYSTNTLLTYMNIHGCGRLVSLRVRDQENLHPVHEFHSPVQSNYLLKAEIKQLQT